MNYTTTKEAFRIVRGKEKNIKSRNAENGYVYFTTDSKKILYGYNDQYLPMGGNSGIYYANKALTEEEKELETITFLMDEIDSENVPSVNDLILNIDDAFYRVTLVTGSGVNSLIQGERMMVAGGGGGSAPGGVSTKIIFKDPTGQNFQRYYTVDAEDMTLRFTCSSQLVENNRIASIAVQIGQNQPIYDNKGYQFGEEIVFDLKPYLGWLSTIETGNTIRITATDEYDNSSSKPFSVRIVQMALSSTSAAIIKVDKGEKLIYQFNPSVANDLRDSSWVEVTLSPKENLSATTVKATFSRFSTNTTNTEYIDISACTHGVYVLKAVLKGILPISEEPVKSNELTNTIIYYDNEVNTPLVTGQVAANKLEQYDTLVVNYYIADQQSTNIEASVIMYAGAEETELTASLNANNTWEKLFVNEGTYEIKLEYSNRIYPIDTVVVNKYSGNIPTIDTEASSLFLYLTSQGRSNNEANKESWVWESNNDSLGTIEGKFEDFLWGSTNGWIPDKTGAVALKLTSGAKFSLPSYEIFANDATATGLTIELDFSVSGVLDYRKPLIHCLSMLTDGSNIQTGFHITGQKATLNSSVTKATTDILKGDTEGGSSDSKDAALQAFTQYFDENERVHLSYVIPAKPEGYKGGTEDFLYVFTYLNGVLSGVKHLGATEQFIQNNVSPALLTFDSTYGDISVYNIRVYGTALNSQAIINNYIADLTDIETKAEAYKANSIFETNGLISLNAIQQTADSLKVPYVLFKGGCTMQKKKTDTVSYSEDGNNEAYHLPLSKSDYRLMSVQMFDTQNSKNNLDIPMQLEAIGTGETIDKFTDIQAGVSYKPKRGVQVYGQGTSSMVYPVKNLRLKFIQDEDYPTVYEGSCPVEIICFKADYMDSSSSHNTSTANLIDNLYTQMQLKTPPQEFMETYGSQMGDNAYDIVTAIRGYPIICFYSEGNSDTYTYIGRYNFNLDKATPEPFGFPPMYIKTGKTVTDNEGRTRDIVAAVGCQVEEVEGATVLPLDEEGKEIVKTLTQCWEILNNDVGSPSKFIYDPNEYDSFMDSLMALTGEKKELNWLNFYEDRYPDEFVGDAEDNKVTPEAAMAFMRLAEWINSTDFTSAQVAASLTEEEKAARKQKFIDEFENYFNKDFALFYYCLTMALLMMDSRAKNMMIATWDCKTWYPIFYDMDSMLGINNTGYNKFSFDTEDDPADLVFTGYDSVLWNNMRECFFQDICEFYARMRGTGGLTVENLLKYYNTNSADRWNEALTTADAEYKYIRPYETGYLDTSGSEAVQVTPGLRNYLYAAQGKRSNHRAWWIKNRLEYLDSKYLAYTYGSDKPGATTFQYRGYSGPEQNANTNKEAYDAAIAQTPTSGLVTLTALNNSYQAIMVGTQIYGPEKATAGQQVTLGPEKPNHEVESWILNVGLIADLGDLSAQYAGNLQFPSNETRWTNLRLGRSARSHPEAYDKYYNANAASINLSNCPYLQYINIAGLTALGSVDLQKNVRLEELDAERCTALTTIDFPRDSILKNLYLPANLTSLKLINQPHLETLSLEGYQNLTQIHLDKISLDTYQIVNSAVNLNQFYLNKINWVVTELPNGLVGGQIKSIDILDRLLSDDINTENNLAKSAALTGIITIDIAGAAVNEYDIYEKYHKLLPNLEIRYSSQVSVTAAKRVQFMNDTEGLATGIHYEVLTNGSKTLATLVSSNGPNGIAMAAPTKAPTIEYSYSFTNSWVDAEGNIYLESEFGSITPEDDLILYPIFDQEIRQYSIKLYDYDGSLVGEEQILDYGSNYSIINYLYRDSSALGATERWAFKGWITDKVEDGTIATNPTYIPYEGVVYQDITGYAYYEKEDAQYVASDNKYFDFTYLADGITDGINATKYYGYEISLKPEYRATLAGKITLPDEYKGQKIISVGKFVSSTAPILITDIFFLNKANSSYIRINDSAFECIEDVVSNQNKLKNIYLPASIRYIGHSAFYKQLALFTIDLNDNIVFIGNQAFGLSTGSYGYMKVSINELPSNLKYLGNNAFFGGGNNVMVSKLPSGLTTLSRFSFWQCPNVNIRDFGYFDTNSQLTTIEQSVLHSCGAATTEIFIGSKVLAIDSTSTNGAFNSYASTTLSAAYFANSYETYGEDEGVANDMGINTSRVAVTWSYQGAE